MKKKSSDNVKEDNRYNSTPIPIPLQSLASKPNPSREISNNDFNLNSQKGDVNQKVTVPNTNNKENQTSHDDNDRSNQNDRPTSVASRISQWNTKSLNKVGDVNKNGENTFTFSRQELEELLNSTVSKAVMEVNMKNEESMRELQDQMVRQFLILSEEQRTLISHQMGDTVQKLWRENEELREEIDNLKLLY